MLLLTKAHTVSDKTKQDALNVSLPVGHVVPCVAHTDYD